MTLGDEIVNCVEGRELLGEWDRWDYRVFGPISFDDEFAIHVYLINKSKPAIKVKFTLDVVKVERVTD